MKIIITFMFYYISSVDNDAKEKLQPFANLTSEESYQSRDLEKVLSLYVDNSYYRSLLM